MGRIAFVTVLACFSLKQFVTGWVISSPFERNARFQTKVGRSTGKLGMAMDYNDPVVGEEFAKVQTMTLEEVEKECESHGVPVSVLMNEMDAKLMLVEIRLRASGRMPGDEKDEIPETFGSPYEEAYYTKPEFKKIVDDLKAKEDSKAANVAAEYLNDRETALERYGSSFRLLIKRIEAALNAKVELTTPTISFSGFPANMGEDALKMTFESLGSIVDFECSVSSDYPIFTGKVEFQDIDSAEKAIDQYDGMDMGVGTKLEIAPVA